MVQAASKGIRGSRKGSGMVFVWAVSQRGPLAPPTTLSPWCSNAHGFDMPASTCPWCLMVFCAVSVPEAPGLLCPVAVPSTKRQPGTPYDVAPRRTRGGPPNGPGLCRAGCLVLGEYPQCDERCAGKEWAMLSVSGTAWLGGTAAGVIFVVGLLWALTCSHQGAP